MAFQQSSPTPALETKSHEPCTVTWSLSHKSNSELLAIRGWKRVNPPGLCPRSPSSPTLGCYKKAKTKAIMKLAFGNIFQRQERWDAILHPLTTPKHVERQSSRANPHPNPNSLFPPPDYFKHVAADSAAAVTYD